MQLAWAQDALSWVEINAIAAAIRANEATGQPSRPTTPEFEHQIRVDAEKIVSFLADQFHPKADFMRSMWREFGKFGYRIDKTEAFLGYRRSAEKGYGRSEYRMGILHEGTNKPSKAIEHYEKGVAMGDSAAHYRLGMMMLLGQHGTPQDYRKGLDYVLAAAATADENAPQGTYVYGMLLAKELNVDIPEAYLPLDLEQARLYVEKAAYLGFSKAELRMGRAYELEELACKFDPALSMHYYALAAWQGEPEADFALSKWFLCGYEGIIMKNEELAFTYAKRAAATLPSAQFSMGYFYEIDIYVQIDLKEAVVWYQKAADGGNKDATARLLEILKN
jgi:TPR repeat protein